MLNRDFAAALAAAANGDEKAFAVLWRDVHPPLLRYLRVVVRDRAVAEDVAGDVWVDVARRLDRFAGDEMAFRGWLFTLARRRAIDALRHAGRTPEDLTGDVADLDRPSGVDTAGTALERLDTERALEMIASLPADQAEVITLRVIAGMDAKDVARLLDKRPGTVRVAAHRGLRTLAARLAASSPRSPRSGVTH